jgi:hypothetical protein
LFVGPERSCRLMARYWASDTVNRRNLKAFLALMDCVGEVASGRSRLCPAGRAKLLAN